jgi:hypothetical protein
MTVINADKTLGRADVARCYDDTTSEASLPLDLFLRKPQINQETQDFQLVLIEKVDATPDCERHGASKNGSLTTLAWWFSVLLYSFVW